MSDDDNIVDFPTGQRKQDVMRERTSKINNFSSPFTNPNYKINSFVVDGTDWKKWTPPSFDNIDNDNIGFSNMEWSFNLTESNQTLLADAMDLCNSIQKQCIELSVENDTVQLNTVLDKLRDALLLSKISSK
jgi:hypothetical protein